MYLGFNLLFSRSSFTFYSTKGGNTTIRALNIANNPTKWYYYSEREFDLRKKKWEKQGWNSCSEAIIGWKSLLISPSEIKVSGKGVYCISCWNWIISYLLKSILQRHTLNLVFTAINSLITMRFVWSIVS